jgi:hypothetical protein
MVGVTRIEPVRASVGVVDGSKQRRASFLIVVKL